MIFFNFSQKEEGMMLECLGILSFYRVQMFAFDLHGQPMCIYGDPAYPLRIHLQAPFCNRVLTPQMQGFNICSTYVDLQSLKNKNSYLHQYLDKIEKQKSFENTGGNIAEVRERQQRC